MAVVDVRTPEEFQRDVLSARDGTVVMFWAAWCPFCRAFKPSFDAHAAKSPGRFAVVHLDEEDNPLWERYDVRVVPSLAFFQDGVIAARKDGRLMRGLSESELQAFLGQVVPPAQA